MKRYAEMTTQKPQQLLALALAAAPVISSFMSKLLRPMARAILNRESTSDDHKHKILNSFIPAAISRTKLAGSQAALNIRRALNSKQYDSAITSLGQHIRDVDDQEYFPQLTDHPQHMNMRAITLISKIVLHLHPA